MSDLVAFVNARLDEREATAQCALMWHQDGHAVFVAHYGAEWGAIDDYDPARELRDVAAKRKLIELAREASGLDRQVQQEFGTGLRDEGNDPYIGDLILQALAAAWSDHPDCDPAWMPQ